MPAYRLVQLCRTGRLFGMLQRIILLWCSRSEGQGWIEQTMLMVGKVARMPNLEATYTATPILLDERSAGIPLHKSHVGGDYGCLTERVGDA